MGEGPRLRETREKLEAALARGGGRRAGGGRRDAEEESAAPSAPTFDILEQWRAQRASTQPTLDWALFDGAGERRWREAPAEHALAGSGFRDSDAGVAAAHDAGSLQERIARVLEASAALLSASASTPAPAQPATPLWQAPPPTVEEDAGVAEEDLLAAWRRRRGWSSVHASHVWEEEAVPSAAAHTSARASEAAFTPASPRLRVRFAPLPPPPSHLSPPEAAHDSEGDDVAALLTDTVADFFSRPEAGPAGTEGASLVSERVLPPAAPSAAQRPTRWVANQGTEAAPDDTVLEELRRRIARCRAELHELR